MEVNMYVNSFHGYNCYSAVLGEYANRKNINEIDKVILSQLTFVFDKDSFWNDNWFAGSTLMPVDRYLEQDLKNFADVTVREHCSNEAQAIERTRKCLEKYKLEIVLVDFYYLESVNWKSLKRYNIVPEHDPHFIIVTDMDKESVSIIDPYYNYQGVITADIFQRARGAQTRQGSVDFKSYDPYTDNVKTVDIGKLLKFRCERFLKDRMYYQIEEMGMEIDKKRLIEGKNQDRHWALNGYNCLRSAVHQHSNLNKLAEMYDINMPSGLGELENQWALIRKKLFAFHNYRFDRLEEISYLVFKTARMEKNYAIELVNSSLL
jgi:hypothetical protein